MFSEASAAAVTCAIMKPELTPPSRTRNGGRPDSVLSISKAMRRSASAPISATASARLSAAIATGSAWKLPPELVARGLTLSSDGGELIYTYDTQDTDVGVAELLKDLAEIGIHYKDLRTEQSSLEDIFVSLVTERNRKS